MKPIERKDGKTLDIQPGDEVVGMTIDVDAMPFVMQTLTQLYSDQVLAVIREYSTNAWDAHVEAGNEDDKIEISLPSSEDEFFRVRDYGNGLDADDIRDIYSKYGKSTKRGSNDVVGMLGMGCKSALAYADEFYVTSIKNGVKVQVNISLDSEGVGQMNIVSQVRTSERSGTEVAVPVDTSYHRNVMEFQTKAESFFSYWPEATVTVDGEEPKRVEGLWLDSKTLLVKGAGHNIIVMGNVPYKNGYTGARGGYVRFVEIGEVEFTPAREDLKDTPYTQAAIGKINNEVRRLKQEKFQKMISSAATGYEAIQKWQEARSYGFEGAPKWKGQDIPEYFNLNGKDENGAARSHMTLTKVKEHRVRRWSRDDSSVTRAWLAGGAVMTGFTGKTLSPVQIEKFDTWKQSQKLDETPRFFLVEKINPEVAKWIDPSKVYNWEDVKAVKLARETTKREYGDVKFDTYGSEGYKSATVEDLPTTNLFYVTKGEQKKYGNNWNKELLDYNYSEWTVVVIGGNQIKKMEREFPNIKQVKAHENELRTNWINSLTPEDVQYIVARQGNTTKYKHLDATKVNDPKLKSAITTATQKRPDFDKAYEIYGGRYGLVSVTQGKEFNDVLAKVYPLAAATLNHQHGKLAPQVEEHVYLYINGVHAEAAAEAKTDSEVQVQS